MKKTSGSDSDTDFQAVEEDSDDADEPDGDGEEAGMELDTQTVSRPSRSKFTHTSPDTGPNRNFKRAEMPLMSAVGVPLPATRSVSAESDNARYHPCIACSEVHAVGYCPLKFAGVEFCNLCGLPHYGVARTCPHLTSVTQLRLMVDAIRQSTESNELKDLARKRVVGIIGDLNQRKRRKLESQQRKDPPPSQPSGPPQDSYNSAYGQTNGHFGSGYFVNGVANQNGTVKVSPTDA